MFSSGIGAATIATKSFDFSLKALKFTLKAFVAPAILFTIAEIFLAWKSDTQDTLKNLKQISDKTLDSRLKEAKKNYLEQKRKYEKRDYTFSERFFTAGENPLITAQKEYQRLLNEKRRRDREFTEGEKAKGDLIANPHQPKLDSSAISNLNRAYLELAQVGMSEYDKEVLSIALKTQSWIEAGVKVNDALDAQSSLLSDLDSKYQTANFQKYFKGEFEIQEKTISLMKEGTAQNIALENLRFEQTIQNLNLELEERLKNGDLSLEQANCLYDTETKLHQKRIADIKEQAIKENAFYAEFNNNLNTALNEQFFNALSGKFTNLQNWVSDMGSSLSTALTQAFSRSLTQAVLNSAVGEAFKRTIAGSFDKIFGDGGLFESYGEDFGESAGKK